MALKKLVSDLTQGLTAYPNHNIPSDSGGFNYGLSTSIFDTLSFNQRSFSYLDPLSAHDNPSPLLPQLLPGVNESIEGSVFYLTDAPDGFIRGGEQNALKKAALDNIRINRFFLTGEGLSFIDNQKALQKSNPIIQEGGPATISNVFEDVLGGILGVPETGDFTNRTFNEQNLIKQITEGGYTGIYYNRAGQDPFVQSIESSKYAQMHKPGRKFDGNVAGTFNNISGLSGGNRLISLGKKLQVGIGNSFNLTNGQSIMEQAIGIDLGGIFSIIDTGLDNLQNFINNPLQALAENNVNGFAPGENIIYQYSGGPGSTYGIGDTILYRYQRTSGDYDHQGNPLSIGRYFTNAASEQGENTVLDLVTGTVNDIVFGGNQILGQNSVFRPGTGEPITTNSFLGGLAGQIFGQSTIDRVSDLFSGGIGGSGGSPSDSYPDTITIQTNQSGNQLKNPIAQKITGNPTNGFIEHTKGRVENKVVPGTKLNKPDDVAQNILNSNSPTPLGNIIGGNSPRNFMTTYYRPKISEFVKDATKNKTNLNYSSYYNKKTVGGRRKIREERIGAGDPGGWGLTTGIDKINALDIHEVTDGAFGDDKYRDFVRFRIEAINTDAPNKSDVMVFRAFLDTWGDSYTSKWNTFQYNGRGEEFFTYGGFARKFNISFKVAAQSSTEMKPIYRKLNYLVSNLAPDYSATGRMRGPYVKLCVGAYMDRVPGFFTSVNIKWNKNYPYEIAIDSPENKDSGIAVLPHVLDVNCQFQPIHDFVPRKSIEEAPFILPGANTSTFGGPWLTGQDKVTQERTVKPPTGDTVIGGDGQFIVGTSNASNFSNNSGNTNFSDNSGAEFAGASRELEKEQLNLQIRNSVDQAINNLALQNTDFQTVDGINTSFIVPGVQLENNLNIGGDITFEDAGGAYNTFNIGNGVDISINGTTGGSFNVDVINNTGYDINTADIASYIQTSLQTQGLTNDSIPLTSNMEIIDGANNTPTYSNTFHTPIYSDIRLKTNIKKIGNTKYGPLYEFNYKNMLNLDYKNKYRGIMAQDLLNTESSKAVCIMDNGYYAVDYNQLDINLEKVT